MGNSTPSANHERQVVRFLKKLGFSDVDGGSEFRVGERQLDAVAGHETTLLIFECTTQTHQLPAKIDQFRYVCLINEPLATLM